MATEKQRAAARSNVKKAQAGAQDKRTLKHLDKSTQKALGQEAAAVRRGDSPTRKDLEAEARKLNIDGRSKMGKDGLKRAAPRPKREERPPDCAARISSVTTSSKPTVMIPISRSTILRARRIRSRRGSASGSSTSSSSRWDAPARMPSVTTVTISGETA